ncbi:MAG: acyl carrier protein [Candidatus Nitrosopumilus sp. bin_32a]
MNVKEWLITWFEKNSDLSQKEIECKFSEDYLAKGWIDSFKFVSFVTEIEEEFKITFSTDEFQNRAFSTLEGLGKIIEARIEKEL